MKKTQKYANAQYIGIDVSKETLDVSLNNMRFSNNREGINKLIKLLKSVKPQCIAMEATGGYERLACIELCKAGLPVALANPRWVRNFAKGHGLLAKNDRIDALLLARFAEVVQPRLYELPDDESLQFYDLLVRRSQLSKMIADEKKRCKQSSNKLISKNIERNISLLQKQMEEIEVMLKAYIESNAEWQKKRKILLEVPGIGDVTIMTLLGFLPELGKLNAKEIASLAGLAPHARDSGTKRGKRMVWGGRASVRQALYLAMLSAIRYNPVIKAFYTRLCQKGKPAKVAMIACARKLLTIMNAMSRDNNRWDVNYIQPVNFANNA